MSSDILHVTKPNVSTTMHSGSEFESVNPMVSVQLSPNPALDKFLIYQISDSVASRTCNRNIQEEADLTNVLEECAMGRLPEWTPHSKWKEKISCGDVFVWQEKRWPKPWIDDRHWARKTGSSNTSGIIYEEVDHKKRLMGTGLVKTVIRKVECSDGRQFGMVYYQSN